MGFTLKLTMGSHKCPPAELALLVLGYLRSEDCLTAYDEFVKTSSHLNSGHNKSFCYFQTTAVYALHDLVDDYYSTQDYLNSLCPPSLRKKLIKTRTLLQKVTIIVEQLRRASLDLSKNDSPTRKVESSTPNLPPKARPPQNVFENNESSVETTKLCDLPGSTEKQKQVKHILPVKQGDQQTNVTYLPIAQLPKKNVLSVQPNPTQKSIVHQNDSQDFTNSYKIAQDQASYKPLNPVSSTEVKLNLQPQLVSDSQSKSPPYNLLKVATISSGPNINRAKITGPTLIPISTQLPICPNQPVDPLPQHKVSIIAQEVIRQPTENIHLYTSEEIMQMPVNIVPITGCVTYATNATNVTYINSPNKPICTPTTNMEAPKSSSTPRRSSHIRVLDFATPQRMLQMQEVKTSKEKPTQSCKKIEEIIVLADTPKPEDPSSTTALKITPEKNEVKINLNKEWDADIRAKIPSVVNDPAPPKSKPKSKKKTKKVKAQIDEDAKQIEENLNESAIKKLENQKPVKSYKKKSKTECQANNGVPDLNVRSTVEPIPISEKTDDVFPHIGKLNVSDFLGTPLKTMMDLPMLTPRLLSSLGQPVSDIKITSIPTPNFGMLGNVLPSCSKGFTPASYSSRPTDYSSGGSYYKPDEYDYVHPTSPVQDKNTNKENDDAVANKSKSHKENDDAVADKPKSHTEAENSNQRTKHVRQCKLKVKTYSGSMSVEKNNADQLETSRKSIDNVKTAKPRAPSNKRQSVTSPRKIAIPKSSKKAPCNVNRKNLMNISKSKKKTILVKKRKYFSSSSDESSVNITGNSSEEEQNLVIAQNSSISDRSESEVRAKMEDKRTRVIEKLKSCNASKYQPRTPKVFATSRLGLINKTRTKSLDSENIATEHNSTAKSRRKSATPRKITNAHMLTDSCLNERDTNFTGSDETLPSLKLSPSSNHETGDVILQIKEFIENPSEEINFTATLIERGFDFETAKKIEKDLLDNPNDNVHEISEPVANEQVVNNICTKRKNTMNSSFGEEGKSKQILTNANKSICQKDNVKKDCNDKNKCLVGKPVHTINNNTREEEENLNNVFPNKSKDSELMKAYKEMVLGNSKNNKVLVNITKVVDQTIQSAKEKEENHLDRSSTNSFDDDEELVEVQEEWETKTCCEGDANFFVTISTRESPLDNHPSLHFMDNFAFGVNAFSEEQNCDITLLITATKEIQAFSIQPTDKIDENETAAAVDSISNTDNLFTPRKSYTQECIDLFDSTLNSIDTPIREDPGTCTKRKLSSDCVESEPKKCKKVDAQYLLNQIDIESVLSKLHGPS